VLLQEVLVKRILALVSFLIMLVAPTAALAGPSGPHDIKDATLSVHFSPDGDAPQPWSMPSATPARASASRHTA